MARIPPPITPAYLSQTANAYLDRYAATRKHLRKLMARKIDLSIAEHGGEKDEMLTALDAVLDGLVASGLLDDEKFAESKARRYVKQGNSRAKMNSKMAASGLDSRQIADGLAAVAEHNDVDTELAAVCAYIRKKKLGPWRSERTAETDFDDLKKLGRGGFGYRLAKRALELEKEEIELGILK